MRHGRRLVFTSTDLVFDGTKSWYPEEDEARPVLGYGRTKREAEPGRTAADRRGDPHPSKAEGDERDVDEALQHQEEKQNR